MSSFFQIFLLNTLLDPTLAIPAPQAPVEIHAKMDQNASLPFYYPPVMDDVAEIDSTSGSAVILSSASSDPSNPLSSTQANSELEFGRQEIMKRLGIQADAFVVTQSHKDKAGVFHMYVSEKVNGIVVDNHNAAVHIQNRKVIAFSSSFTSSQTKLQKRSIAIAAANPPISIDEAVEAAVAIYKAPLDNPQLNLYTSQYHLETWS